MVRLIAGSMSWVIAFFFSGRRSVMPRVASSSGTNRWPGMMRSLGHGERQALPLASLQDIPYIIRAALQAGRGRFPRWLIDAHGEITMQLTGIHHLTAISAKPRENLAFYTGLLGMRLVKKTVNQDDVSAYHLFYADGKANPGSDLTFFDFPAAPERRGSNSISRTSLRVAGEKSLGFWRDRLKKAGAPTRDGSQVDRRLTPPVEDREGQRAGPL